MPKALCRISKRTDECEALDPLVEDAAVNLGGGFMRPTGGDTARYWRAFAATAHAQTIRKKFRDCVPGCRAGFEYWSGLLPPIPLLAGEPTNHMSERDFLLVDGVKHWHCGSPWQMCQAEHLRAIGEVDAGEWQRFLKWKKSGFKNSYQFEGGGSFPIVHGCY